MVFLYYDYIYAWKATQCIAGGCGGIDRVELVQGGMFWWEPDEVYSNFFKMVYKLIVDI